MHHFHINISFSYHDRNKKLISYPLYLVVTIFINALDLQIRLNSSNSSGRKSREKRTYFERKCLSYE